MSASVDYAPGAYALGSAGGDGGGGQPPRKPDGNSGRGGSGWPEYGVAPTKSSAGLLKLLRYLTNELERPCNFQLIIDILAFLQSLLEDGYTFNDTYDPFARALKHCQLLDEADDTPLTPATLFQWLYRGRDAQRLSDAASRRRFHLEQLERTVGTAGPHATYLPSLLQAATRGRFDYRLDASSDSLDCACNVCLAAQRPCFQFLNQNNEVLHDGCCVPCWTTGANCSFFRSAAPRTTKSDFHQEGRELIRNEFGYVRGPLVASALAAAAARAINPTTPVHYPPVRPARPAQTSRVIESSSEHSSDGQKTPSPQTAIVPGPSIPFSPLSNSPHSPSSLSVHPNSPNSPTVSDNALDYGDPDSPLGRRHQSRGRAGFGGLGNTMRARSGSMQPIPEGNAEEAEQPSGRYSLRQTQWRQAHENDRGSPRGRGAGRRGRGSS